ncbi:MAG: hypothetical protein V2A63_01635 [Patescibacteria group bacterium]
MQNLFSFLFFLSLICLAIGLIKPKLFKRFLKERANRKGVAKVFGTSTIVFFFLIGATEDSQKVNSSLNEQIIDENISSELVNEGKIDPVDFQIVSTDDYSIKAVGDKSLSDFSSQEIADLPTNKRMSYRILVSPEIKENQVEPTINEIISEIISQDDETDEISLLLYSDENLVDGAYDVAMATWALQGKWGNTTPEIAEKNDRSNYRTSIQIKENLEEYLAQRGKSEDKFGFSEAERRQIFDELLAAEHRGMEEAETIYPLAVAGNFEKNIDKERELMDKYKLEIREKYGISEDIEASITLEAVEEGWF